MGKVISVDGRDLDRLSCAAGDGRDIGRPGRARLRALRRWLVAALGEDGYHLGQRLLVDGVSCREFAAEIGKDRSNACRLMQRLRERLRAATLAALATEPMTEPNSTAAWVRGRLIGFVAPALADAAVAAVDTNPGGCTISPRTGRRVCSRVWAVPLTRTEEWHVSVTRQNVREYVRRQSASLFRVRHYFGVRRAVDGRYCLAVTRLFPDAETAVAFARANRRPTVLNVRSGRVLPVAVSDHSRERAA